MAHRSNHYSVAFEEYLRTARVPYVVVDERRRSLLHQASLKSMDFIIYSNRLHNLLVDLKGRRFPSGNGSSRHKWENWATEDDLTSLLQWQGVFGEGFRALLVFAYHITDGQSQQEFDNCFHCRERTYAFYGVWADEYRSAMRVRSASWKTVSLPRRAFHRLCYPIRAFL